MSDLEITTRALEEIVRLWKRSNKRDHNTCRQMYSAAQRALEDIAVAEYLKSALPPERAEMEKDKRTRADSSSIEKQGEK